MRSSFWKGLVWGSILGTVLGSVIGPMAKPQKKPLTERSAEAIVDTTRGIVKKAKHARKRLMKKLD